MKGHSSTNLAELWGRPAALPWCGLSLTHKHCRDLVLCSWLLVAGTLRCPSSTALTNGHLPVLTDEQKSRIQAMKPMTKEEWDARQSVIRRVVDPETGRTRYGPSGQKGGRMALYRWRGEEAVLLYGATSPLSPSAAKA